MLRNYLTVGFRALTKNRAYAAINLLGLAIGMAACLMILLFIRYEASYDRWLPDAKRTFQVQTWWPRPTQGEPLFLQMASYRVRERLVKDFPAIENAVYVLGGTPVLSKDGQVASAENYLTADGDFLAVVSLPLVRGTRDALSRNDTAVLTKSEAIRRFGTDDVLGRTITLIQKGQIHDFRITGILADLPRNSHMKIAAVIRRDFESLFANERYFLNCWSCQSGWVYVKLRPGADVTTLQAAMPAWEKRNIPDENGSALRYNAGDEADWHFVNVEDVHLGRAQDGAMRPGNDNRTIATFAIVAALILGMAVINFTNLATARASQRAREVALRKVLGAARGQLVLQFVGESLLLAGMAMLLALALVELTLQPFATFLDADLTMRYLGRDGILLSAIGLVLVVGLLGGLYPALFLSRFQPAQVLRANRSSAETPGSGRLRTLLVVGQFAVSIGLIICTAVIYAQTVYARSLDPGYQRENILQVENLNRYQLINTGDALARQMMRLDGVKSASLTNLGIATGHQSNLLAVLPGDPKQILLGNYAADANFLDAAGLRLLAGRWFDDRPADDTTMPYPKTEAMMRSIAARGINVVLNERGARALGFATPADALGKTFRTVYFEDAVGPVTMRVIGVVGDARFRSVRTPIEPTMLVKARSGMSWMLVRYEGNPAEVRARIEQAWKAMAPDVPFEARFSEEIVGDLYRGDEARAKTFAGFAVLSIVVGCLGLFGLASFTAERRTKEIGIRKVLGARTRDIARLLVWQFSRPVLVANLIAWPIAWWVMRDWLNGFDARIALGPVPFLAAGLLALAIAIATIATHAVRVARANPIQALRYE